MALSLVGKRNLQPRNFTTGQTSCTYRIKYPVAVNATNLQLTFPAWATGVAGTGDTATGNAVTLGAVYVEYNSTLYPVTFSAASSVAITSGANVTSDAVAGLTVTAGTTLYVRTYVTVTSGGQWPALYGAVIYPDEVSRPGSNLANATGDLQGTGQALGSVYGPARIFGDVTAPLYAISLAGDSILAGVNDSFSDETQTGYWQRALYPGTRPYSFVALPGESASQFLTSQGAKRNDLIGDYAQYFVNEYGINDLQGGATLAQLQARVRSIAVGTSGDATLVKRYQQTLGPKSSSTDSWATTTNQTTDGINTIRVQFNDWVRDGMPETSGVAVATGTVGALRAGSAGHPYSGYLEVADLCESARNSGIWKAGYTTDGLHPGPTGNANMAAALDLTPFVNTGPAGIFASFTGSGTLSATVSVGAAATAGLTYSTTSPAIRSSAFQGTAATQAWASNSFSPPANSLILVEAHATQSFNNAWNVPTITDSLGTPLTWNRRTTQADVTFAGVVSTVSLFWALCPTAQTGMTVTVTQSLGGSGQTITFTSVDVRVFTGHDTTTPIGTVVNGATTAQALAVSLAPAGTGSALMLAANNAAAASAATTAGTGEFLAGETHTGTSFVSAWYGLSAGPTIPATTQTLDLTGNTAARWQYIAYEVRALVALPIPDLTMAPLRR